MKPALNSRQAMEEAIIAAAPPSSKSHQYGKNINVIERDIPNKKTA